MNYCQDCGCEVAGDDSRPGLCPECYDQRGIADRELNELRESTAADPLNLHLANCPKCCTNPMKLCPVASDILQSIIPKPEPFNPLRAVCFLCALPLAAWDWVKRKVAR